MRPLPTITSGELRKLRNHQTFNASSAMVEGIMIVSSTQLNLYRGSKDLEFHNVERVRSFLENNLGCTKKEVVFALNLHPRTVAKAIKIIRGQQ
jgi:hypothetical protein